MTSSDDLLGKKVLGRYEVLRVLAVGGQGVIYLARNIGAAGFVRPVVVKALRPHSTTEFDAMMLEHFAREARIMGRLRHPNIVQVIDFAQEGDAYYMVLEYVHGYHLGVWSRYLQMNTKPFAVSNAVYALVQVLDALHYAHTLNDESGEPLHIVHRDISLSNVLVDVDGHVKLTDFGIARMRNDATAAVDTTPGIKGKLGYLAPELFQGASPSASADIYACGVMLHELISGRSEFRVRDLKEALHKAHHHVPTSLESLREDVSPAVAEVAKQALARDPKARFATAKEFADALRRAAEVPLDKLAQGFSSDLRRDFREPALVELAKLPPLSELQASWQHTRAVGIAGDGDVTISYSSTASGGATDVAQGRASDPAATPSPAAARQPLTLVLLALTAIATTAAVAVALWVFTHGSATEATEYVYVTGSAATERGQSEPSAVASAAAGEEPAAVGDSRSAMPGEVEAAVKDAPPAPKGPTKSSGTQRAAELRRAFASQGRAVQDCFSAHAADLEGNPRISVLFEIARSGQVTQANLDPGTLETTALGACIVRVAKQTRFGAQPEALAFRIPITARKK